MYREPSALLESSKGEKGFSDQVNEILKQEKKTQEKKIQPAFPYEAHVLAALCKAVHIHTSPELHSSGQGNVELGKNTGGCVSV